MIEASAWFLLISIPVLFVAFRQGATYMPRSNELGRRAMDKSGQRNCPLHIALSSRITDDGVHAMRKYSAMFAVAALLASTSMASAQSRNYDSSGAPKSSGSSQRSGGGLVDNSTSGSGAGSMSAPANPNPPTDASADGSKGAPQGPDNGGTLNPRAPSNAR
jgi:hypothetical protein